MRAAPVLSVLVCSSIFGCAIVIAPTGGEKDIIPPLVIKSTPANYSTNFSEKEIVIEFDEFVKLKDLYNNFIVSPPLDKKPMVVIRGKSLVIKLDEALPAKATINFNFGNAIVDLHEGNPILDYHFVVSTGTYVDSLSISGKAITATTLSAAKDVWVMMYDCQDYKTCDSLPSKVQPNYITKTNAQGKFSIHNIKKGSYKVFGLIDKNRNNLFDLPNESIAFIGKLVEAGDTLEFDLSVFDQEDDNQMITKVINVERGMTKIAFKLPVDDIQIDALNFSSKTRWEVVDYSPRRDTVYYWNTSGIDSLTLHITDKRYSFDDTIAIGTGQKEELKTLRISTSVSTSHILEIGKSLKIQSSKPLTIYDQKKIKLIERIDSVTTEEIDFDLSFEDEARKVLNLDCDWKPGAAYSLGLEQGALTDFFGSKSDTVNADFNVRREDHYGTLAVEIIFPVSNQTYIVQLLDARGKVSRENLIDASHLSADGKRKLKYEYITPGQYKLKVIYDSNGNTRWDTGDHLAGRQPERIAFSKEQILIRSNWDLVLDWELDAD